MSMPVTQAIRAERRERAEAEQAVWAELGPARQLEMLDRRLGKGKGAKKQRARLAKGIHGS